MDTNLSSVDALELLSYNAGHPKPMTGGEFYSIAGKLFLKNPPIINLFLRKINPLERECSSDIGEGLIFINGLFIRSGMLTTSKHTPDLGVYDIDIDSRFGDLQIPGYIRTFSKEEGIDIIGEIGGRELWVLGNYSNKGGLKIKTYGKAL